MLDHMVWAFLRHIIERLKNYPDCSGDARWQTANSYETVFFPTTSSREREEFLNIMNDVGVGAMAWEHLIANPSNTTAMKH